MTTTELLALFRQEVQDLQQPYLWSDAQVYAYINEAQKQFCRDTYGIADARSFAINVLADTEWYTLDPRILKLRTATNAATGRPILFTPVEKMEQSGLRFTGVKGPLRIFITGLEEHVVRAYPVPDTDVTVNLTVFRLPSDVEAGDDLEIAPQHHYYLLHWVKYLAYSVHDADAFDPKAADTSLAKHIAYTAKALTEQSRERHEAGQVIYGGL